MQLAIADDGTRELVASIHPQKIKIIDTVWDERLQEGGHVLAAETDKGFKEISDDSDWCIYIQGDEVLHEDGYAAVQAAMQKWKGAKEVDGLLFNYRHFYGSFDYVAVSSKWYRHEIRVVRNDKRIHSYKDAQGFRKLGNEKLNVKRVNAYIHHYGWVREPAAMQAKLNNFGLYYHGAQPNESKTYAGPFDYSGIDALKKFEGTHPQVMQERINKINWAFYYDLSYNKLKPKEKFKNLAEKLIGFRPFEYRNYKII